MLLEIAIADAYGMPYEYTGEKISYISGFRKQHPKHPVAIGKYGDDAQMSIAIAELMFEKNWSVDNIKEKFYNNYHRDPRTGYAHRFYDFLNTSTLEEFKKDLYPFSEKSGGAMRAVPVGYFHNEDLVISKTAQQASATHYYDGVTAAIITSLAAHYFIYNKGPKKSLIKYLKKYVDLDFYPWKKKVGSAGMDSVRAAISAVYENDNLNDILLQSINYTGDVDTVAAIAVGIGSCSSDIENNLPYYLIDGLENGLYGKDFLIELDDKLKKQFLK
jgi:ADP-ribosylglycohydrolase